MATAYACWQKECPGRRVEVGPGHTESASARESASLTLPRALMFAVMKLERDTA